MFAERDRRALSLVVVQEGLSTTYGVCVDVACRSATGCEQHMSIHFHMKMCTGDCARVRRLRMEDEDEMLEEYMDHTWSGECSVEKRCR